MRAIVFDQFGPEEVLRIGQVDSPLLGSGDLRIAVVATALNRADLLQRQGQYPPPPGASPILGLECAGTVADVGSKVVGWRPGDRVMALLPGGGYAEEVVVDAGSAMAVPDTLSDIEAAAIPEVFLTSFLTIFDLGRFSPEEAVLVHGGGSGIGTAATTLVKLAGGRVIVTAGSAEKCARCLAHGAEVAINYQEEDFAPAAKNVTGGRGVDIILDHIGARYVASNLETLTVGGRLVIIGSMGGRGTAAIDISALLGKRQQIIGSTLRARAAPEKAALVRSFLARFGDDLRGGRIRPVIDRVFPLHEAAEAHRLMSTSQHFGKIVLKVR